MDSEKSHQYLIIASLNEDWLSSEQAKNVQKLMKEKGWDVDLRMPMADEIYGTYRFREDGSLEMLGYKLSEKFCEDICDAAQTAIRGKRT